MGDCANCEHIRVDSIIGSAFCYIDYEMIFNRLNKMNLEVEEKISLHKCPLELFPLNMHLLSLFGD